MWHVTPNAALRKAWLKYNKGVRITPRATLIGIYTEKRKRKMADIFDTTRRKISKHVSKEIAPAVFKEKEAEFKAKVAEEIANYLASAKCSKRIQTSIEYAAIDEMQKYFRSRAFRLKCHEVAKGMVK